MVSLSRYVIMQVLLAATFIVQQIVQILAHWFLARKSCIFNEEKRQNSSFYHEKQFFTFSPPFFAFPHFNWTMLLYYFWNAEGVGSSVREVWFLQDVDRKISDLILTVGRPHSRFEADPKHCACLVFSTRYFRFCEINDWHELKGFQQDSFIGTERMYSVKHLLEKKKIFPCNFYSLRKAENF